MPAIEKMLVVSTQHIQTRTAADLGTAGPLCVALSYTTWHEHGWLIYASSEQARAVAELGYQDLETLINVAILRQCSWLRLDCDAESEPGWTTYATNE